jgi:hypothetical protein
VPGSFWDAVKAAVRNGKALGSLERKDHPITQASFKSEVIDKVAAVSEWLGSAKKLLVAHKLMLRALAAKDDKSAAADIAKYNAIMKELVAEEGDDMSGKNSFTLFDWPPTTSTTKSGVGLGTWDPDKDAEYSMAEQMEIFNKAYSLLKCIGRAYGITPATVVKVLLCFGELLKLPAGTLQVCKAHLEGSEKIF